MLTPTLPLLPSADPLITAELVTPKLSTRLRLLVCLTSAVALAVPNTKLLSIAALSEAALAIAAALSCWLPEPAATLTPTLPLAPAAELLISAEFSTPSFQMRLPVLLCLSLALAVALIGIIFAGGV